VIATNADVVSTGNDLTATNADVVSTGNDVIATNADVVLTWLDVVATNADVVLTGLDVIAAAASALAAAASAASVNLPTLTPGDAYKMVQVNAGETGYDFVTYLEIDANNAGVINATNTALDGTELIINHKAGGDDTSALCLVVDVNNYHHCDALCIPYTLTGQADPEYLMAIHVVFNRADSTGGQACGIVTGTTGTGTSEVYSLGCLAEVNVICQLSGSLGNADQYLVVTSGPTYTDRTTEFTTAGNDVPFHVADNDSIFIGSSTAFDELAFELAVNASGAGTQSEFYYSNAGAWTQFFPNDGTNSFRNEGTIAWNSGDLTGWVADDLSAAITSRFWIEIKRTRNVVTTPPTESKVEIAAGDNYSWNKHGDVSIRDLACRNIVASGGITGAIDTTIEGTVSTSTTFIELTNTGNAASMTSTETTVQFNQWYYDGATPAVADSARISVGTLGNWTSTASTQDSYMDFFTVRDGAEVRAMRFETDTNTSVVRYGDAAESSLMFHHYTSGSHTGEIGLWGGYAQTSSQGGSVVVHGVSSSNGVTSIKAGNTAGGHILLHTGLAPVRMKVDFAGNVGVGAFNAGADVPVTLLELESEAPYLTLHNTSHEDSDGGRESRILFRGEQSGGEETVLGMIQASHDGAVDDQKGKLGFYTNDGSDGTSPTLRWEYNSAGAYVGQQANNKILTSADSAVTFIGGGTLTNTANGAYIKIEGNDNGGANQGGGIDINAGNESANGNIKFQTHATNAWMMLYNAGELQGQQVTNRIMSSADTSRLNLGGGSTASAANGAAIQLRGQDYGGAPASNNDGDMYLYAAGAAGAIKMYTKNTHAWSVLDNAGELQGQQAVNMINVVQSGGDDVGELYICSGLSQVAAAGASVHLYGDDHGANPGDLFIVAGSSGGVYIQGLSDASATPLEIDTGTGLVTYDSSSARFKEDITASDLDTSLIYDFNLKKYKRTKDVVKKWEHGLIAEETAEILPGMEFRNATNTIVSFDRKVLTYMLMGETKKHEDKINGHTLAIDECTMMIGNNSTAIASHMDLIGHNANSIVNNTNEIAAHVTLFDGQAAQIIELQSEVKSLKEEVEILKG